MVCSRMCLGLLMGQRVTPRMAIQLGTLFSPAITSTIVMLIGCLALAFLPSGMTDRGAATCLLRAAPAGLSRVTVLALAEEIGADSLTAAVFHTARIMGIVSIYQWIVSPFSSTA